MYWHLQIGPDKPWCAITFNQWRWQTSKIYKLLKLNNENY
jgi:hypothetical protein